jgi:hypothetical protein
MDGIPIIQNELIPLSKASSTDTRVEVAPSHEPASVRKMRRAGRSRDARKKSSKLFILLEKKKLIRRSSTK